MNPPENTPNANVPFHRRRAPKRMLPVILLAVIAGTFALKIILPPHWQARLELKNTGTKPMTVVFRDKASVTKPGEIWKGDFRARDTITIYSGESATGPSHILTMPAKNPKPWTPSNSTAQHWTAEVNVDDPANIRVENRRYTEVTSPPSPWEPWP